MGTRTSAQKKKGDSDDPFGVGDVLPDLIAYKTEVLTRVLTRGNLPSSPLWRSAFPFIASCGSVIIFEDSSQCCLKHARPPSPAAAQLPLLGGLHWGRFSWCQVRELGTGPPQVQFFQLGSFAGISLWLSRLALNVMIERGF